jgi:polyketide cyclase/dehydrase/lipid transport protein
MGRARAAAVVELPPAEALERFANVRAWGSFVDGFARCGRIAPEWPVEGSEVSWESTPGGRGRVRERIESYVAPPPAPDVAPQSRPGRLVTHVEDDSLTGVQTATFAPHGAGTRLELGLDYELKRRGALTGITDALFIRRAIRDSLRRTAERFASDAANRPREDAGGPAG